MFKTRANQNDHLKENRKTFRSRSLHFIHLDRYSLLTKIDELREIIKIANPAVIGITETKIDNSINDAEGFMDGYCAIRRDRDKKGGRVVFYVTNKICYDTKMKQKISLSNFLFRKQNQLQLELFINLQIKQGFKKYCQTV